MISHKKILIADDDREDRMVINDTLERLFPPGTLQFSEDGIELLDTLSEMSSNEVSLVVLDLNMPRLNGMETLRSLKKNALLASIPVMILSTSISTRQISECLEMGAVHYLTKPSTYREAQDMGIFIQDFVNNTLKKAHSKPEQR